MFVFVQKQDANNEGLKRGEMNSYVVYVYYVHFPLTHAIVQSALQRDEGLSRCLQLLAAHHQPRCVNTLPYFLSHFPWSKSHLS